MNTIKSKLLGAFLPAMAAMMPASTQAQSLAENEDDQLNIVQIQEVFYPASSCLSDGSAATLISKLKLLLPADIPRADVEGAINAASIKAYSELSKGFQEAVEDMSPHQLGKVLSLKDTAERFFYTIYAGPTSSMETDFREAFGEEFGAVLSFESIYPVQPANVGLDCAPKIES